LIDTAELRRLSDQAGLDPNDLRRLAEAMADSASRVLIDQPAVPTSLRPNELRNFHWVTVAPATGPAWHILFEYHRGRPHVAGIRLEAVAVTA